MATVTGYTAERMQDIEDGTVVDGNIVGDNLILVRHDGGQIDAGSVRGPQGIQGPAGLAAVLPGIISMFGGNTAPAGYLLCNGAAVSRTTYAALYAQIGVLHGAGDGTTTFNLPDMQARFPIGKGVATYADVVGEKGGSKDAVAVSHQHDIDHSHSVPNHQHGMTHTHTAGANPDSQQHTHIVDIRSDIAGHHLHGWSQSEFPYVAGANGFPYTMGVNGGMNMARWGESDNGSHDHRVLGNTTTPSQAHTHTVNVSSHTSPTDAAGAQSLNHVGKSVVAGEAGTDKNLPPYIVVNFIIKT